MRRFPGSPAGFAALIALQAVFFPVLTHAQTVARVDITADSAIVVAGQRIPATARAKDANGEIIPGATFTWATRAANIATVDAVGVVTALFPGTVQITARAGNVTGTLTFTVVPLRVEVSGPPKIRLGATAALAARSVDINGATIPNVTFAWSSDNTSVATVNANGVVLGVGIGEVPVVATSGGYSARIVVQVDRPQDYAVGALALSERDLAPMSTIRQLLFVSNLNNRGEFAFSANLGTTVAVIRQAAGRQTLIARAGDPAPLGGTFSAFSSVYINNRSDVAFLATVTAGISPVLMLYRGNQLHPILASGDPLEVGGTITAITPAVPALDDSGAVYVTLNVSNPTYSGVFRISMDRGAEPMVRTFDTLSIGSPTAFAGVSASSTGHVAAIVTAGNRRGVYYLSTSTEPVAIAENTAPGSGGGTFNLFQAVRVAPNGTAYVLADMTGQTRSLYALSGAGLNLIARVQGAAPSGGTYTALTALYSANDLGIGISAAVNNTGDGFFFLQGAIFGATFLRGTAASGGEVFTRLDGGWINDANEFLVFGVSNQHLSVAYRRVAQGPLRLVASGDAVAVPANVAIAVSGLRPAVSTSLFLAGSALGLWRQDVSGVVAIAVPGGLAPPRREAFTAVVAAASNSHGSAAILANTLDLSRLTANAAIYRYVEGSLTEWIPRNMASANGAITAFGGQLAINAADQVAFTGTVAGQNSVLATDHGDAALTPADIRVLTAVGRPSPLGGTFTGFTNLQIAPSGTVVFTATANGGPAGIYMIPPGAAPVAIASAAQYAGLSAPSVGGDSVFFAAAVNGLATLFRFADGQAVPVLTAGANLPIATPLLSLGGFAAQEDGSVAFVGNAARTGIFVRRPDGSLSVVTLLAERTPVSGRFSNYLSMTFASSRVLFAGAYTVDRTGLFAGDPLSDGGPATDLTAFAFGNRGASTVRTIGGGGSVATGYAMVQNSPGNSSPSGLAIFGFRQNGVLVSEATVPASTAVLSGRIPAEVMGPVNTGVAIANTGSQPVTIAFRFTNAAGTDFGSGMLPLAAGEQVARFLSEPPFNSGSNFQGTFTFSASAPVHLIALRGYTNERSEFLVTTLPVLPLTDPGTAPVFFPHFAEGGGWSTQVTLVNVTDQAVSGTIEFFDGGAVNAAGTPTAAGRRVAVTANNQLSATFSYAIAPSSAYILRTSGSGTLVSGSVRVWPAAGSRSPAGLLVFGFKRNGVTVSEAGVAGLRPGSSYRLFTETAGNLAAQQAGSFQTGIAIANPADQAVTVQIDLSNVTGAAVGSLVNLTIPAQGQRALFVGEIPGFAAFTGSFTGLMRLSSSTPVSVLGLRGRYNERGDFLITTVAPTNEADPPQNTTQVFPHFADGGGYTTQFILYSGVVNQSSNGSMVFFNQSGQRATPALR